MSQKIEQAKKWFASHASDHRNRVIAMCDDLEPVYELLAEALASHAPSGDCPKCEDTHNIKCWCKCHFSDAPSEAAAQPTWEEADTNKAMESIGIPPEIEHNDH